MTLTKSQRIGITAAAVAVGAMGGWVLSGNAGTTYRERVLSTALAATAALGATHTVLTLVSMEESSNG